MNTIRVSVIFLLLLMHQIYALRCRSGNQQANDEFRKVMQKCKHRYSESDKTNNNDDSSSSDDESSEGDSTSDGAIFESDFFTGSKNNRQKNDSPSMGRENLYQNHRYEQNNRDSWSHSSNSNSPNNSRNQMSNKNSGNNDWRQENNRDMLSDNNQRNSTDSDKQDVNHRGYPERGAVIGTMVQGIQNPVLRDFVEESIIECFHFLNSMMNLDKCKFSQNLVTCFGDKGRERCEDWDD